jgi:hypothetical protein
MELREGGYLVLYRALCQVMLTTLRIFFVCLVYSIFSWAVGLDKIGARSIRTEPDESYIYPLYLASSIYF